MNSIKLRIEHKVRHLEIKINNHELSMRLAYKKLVSAMEAKDYTKN